MDPPNWDVVFHVRVVRGTRAKLRALLRGPGFRPDVCPVAPAPFCRGRPGGIHRCPCCGPLVSRCPPRRGPGCGWRRWCPDLCPGGVRHIPTYLPTAYVRKYFASALSSDGHLISPQMARLALHILQCACCDATQIRGHAIATLYPSEICMSLHTHTPSDPRP